LSQLDIYLAQTSAYETQINQQKIREDLFDMHEGLRELSDKMGELQSSSNGVILCWPILIKYLQTKVG
jgi:hypothetical protein